MNTALADGHDRFAIGDMVEVKITCAEGNPRTPHYLRGRVATIVRRYGVVDNPLDHHLPYPPLYTLEFHLSDRERVLADLHEDWLEPAALRTGR